MTTTSNKGMETKQPSFFAGVTRGKTLVRCVLTVALVVAALLMAACNSKSSIFGTTLQGKYSAPRRGFALDLEVEFKPGNKANFNYSTMGARGPITEVDYEVRGKEVLLKNPQGTMVGTITDDGCLDFGSIYGKLCKQVDRTLSGTYSLPKESLLARHGAHWQIEFKSGNKANWSYSSPQHQQQPTVEPTYEIHGEEVTLRFPNATTRVATITDDGCLDFAGMRAADGHPIGIPMKVCK